MQEVPAGSELDFFAAATFAQLGASAEILEALKSFSISTPSHVQAAAYKVRFLNLMVSSCVRRYQDSLCLSEEGCHDDWSAQELQHQQPLPCTGSCIQGAHLDPMCLPQTAPCARVSPQQRNSRLLP